MSNKYVKAILLIIIGLFAMAAAKNAQGDISNITNIVGFLVLVAGIVEICKKKKVKLPTNNPQG